MDRKTTKAIVLLSGGLDSAVILALAKEKGRQCKAISFDYGQRHCIELTFAKALAEEFGVEHQIMTIDPQAFSGSSLVSSLEMPKDRTPSQIQASGIPNTYVPARNTLFLALATAAAETYGASEIYMGANLSDHRCYPDCRPEFYDAFQQVVNLATKASVESAPPKILTPLIRMDKKAIVQEGRRLLIPFEKTFSCYDPQEGAACGRCDACCLRQEALTSTSPESPL